MQKNLMESLVKFIIKYIWMFCFTLTVLECVSTMFNASVLMKRASDGVMRAVCGEVSSRVSSILNLMTGISREAFISDASQSTFDRAISLYPFQLSFNLFMIGVTDKEGNVSSSDETAPSKDNYNLMFRDYMQRLYSTGTSQITDPIIAGSDGTTINYTIAVPILEDKKVVGSVFGSIYFDEIQEILDRSAAHKSNLVYLFGREQTLISKADDLKLGATFADLSKKSYYINTNMDTIYQNILKKNSVNYWVVDSGRVYYVQSRDIAPANWTLLYCTDFFTMLQPLLPTMMIKIMIYFIMCSIVSRMGHRYFARKLSAVNNLLTKMGSMQHELFQNDSADYSSLLDISQSGLVDQLTGLCTRTFFLKKMETWNFDGSSRGAVMFIDLDGLKSINDSFGHEMGDKAILSFARILKDFELKLDAVSARYGGDEFIFSIRDHGEKDMKAIGREISAKMSCEITSGDGRLIPIHASIGIALFPEDGNNLSDLICKADLALYESKHQGKNRCSFYSDLDI